MTAPRERHLWRRRADTLEGNLILREARRLSWEVDNLNLSDGELIRLAYWGVSGDPSPAPRQDGEPEVGA